MVMRHYATVCRADQLPVLFGSMRRHCAPFTLHVLAWDWEEPRRLDQSGGDGAQIWYTPRDIFLARHPELAPERLPGPPRRPVDVVATVRWAFFADVVEATGEPLTTLDGDLWWWSSPEPLFAELAAAGARFAVSPHRIPPRAAGRPGVCAETHRQYGLYNSGLVYAADPAPLREMAALTRAWSYGDVRRHPEDGEPDYGDQGALERVAARHGAHVIRHPGVNVAPWNLHAYDLTAVPWGLRTDLLHYQPRVDGVPVVCFHYSSLRLGPGGELLQLADRPYDIDPDGYAAAVLYEPYLAALRAGRAG